MALPAARANAADEVMRRRLAQVYAHTGGNAARMGQILADEHGLQPPYSTLTRWVREAELRAAPKRSGEYHFALGEEMQHDTSPHRIEVASKPLTAQCAALTYSRRLFMQYWPRFSRFEAKHFLLHAAQFMDGTCPRCVIDNTSVVLAGGAGPDAVIAPEMAARSLGFEFLAHRVNAPNRKGRIEKPFAWIEGNFLPGRSFASFDELNAQAHRGGQCQAQEPKRALGMSAEAGVRDGEAPSEGLSRGAAGGVPRDAAPPRNSMREAIVSRQGNGTIAPARQQGLDTPWGE